MFNLLFISFVIIFYSPRYIYYFSVRRNHNCQPNILFKSNRRLLCTSAGDIQLHELVYPNVANPEEENEDQCEENNVIQDVIQPPTKYEVMRALEGLQTCTFYDADNEDEMRVKVNTFSKLYDILKNKVKRQKALTDFYVHNKHKL